MPIKRLSEIASLEVSAMFNRGLALKLAAALLTSALPALAAATTTASSVALTITSPATIYFGQSVDGYANVTTSDGTTPTGSITFYDGAQNICTIPVTPSATCPASTGADFSTGSHTITAVYSGDLTHAGATSNVATVTVLQDPTAVSLVSSANPAISGQPVILTATAAGSYATPTGTVTFLDGTSILGTATLNSSGIATFSTASLSAGSHSMTASYAGDPGSESSVSPALVETVGPAPIQSQGSFTITVTGSGSVGVGRSADLLVTVTAEKGFTQPVELSCSGLPTESACTFGQHTIPAGGGTTTLAISTIAPHDCGSSTPYFLGASLPFAAAVLLLPFDTRRRFRRFKGLLVASIAFCGISALSGCGTCTDLGTRPGSYTIRVIGTPVGAGASALSGGAVAATITMKVVL